MRAVCDPFNYVLQAKLQKTMKGSKHNKQTANNTINALKLMHTLSSYVDEKTDSPHTFILFYIYIFNFKVFRPVKYNHVNLYFLLA